MVLLSVMTDAMIAFFMGYLWHNIGRQSNEWFDPRMTSIMSSLSNTASLATVLPISITKFTFPAFLGCKVS